jgi:hypothetical protein
MTTQVKQTATTIANRRGREGTIGWLGALGIVGFVLLGDNRLSLPARVTCLAIAGLASIWPLCRGWRMGVRFDDHGITVHKLWRTDRFGWPDVKRIEDQRCATGSKRWIWNLNIVLRDGRVITTYLGTLKETASPKALIAIRQAATRHEVPAELRHYLG